MSNCVVIKVCLLGSSTVGKTSIASRYVQDVFHTNSEPTVGAAYLSRYCSAPGGTLYKFQIWDTAGQERYKTLVPLYYRGASVILIVYDISNRDSFIYGVQDWVKELRGKVQDGAILVVVGNKLDLALFKRQVEEAEGRQYAEKINAMFFETSAKTGHNVANIFHEIAVRLEKNEHALTAAPSAREQNLRRKDTVTVRKSMFQNSQSQQRCCLR